MKFKLSPGHMIALGFAALIVVGALLLLLPISRHQGVTLSPVDALFTATSATCVTGLMTVDIADTFSTFGQVVVVLLIQSGGLGIACVGVGLILFMGGRVSLKNRLLVKESWNVTSFKGMLPLVRSVLLLTLFIEGGGAILGYAFFSQHYPWVEAIKISVFHSISAFNNAGLDLLGGMQSLTPFRGELFLNLLTAGLIIVGGLGFLVLLESCKQKSSPKMKKDKKILRSKKWYNKARRKRFFAPPPQGLIRSAHIAHVAAVQRISTAGEATSRYQAAPRRPNIPLPWRNKCAGICSQQQSCKQNKACLQNAFCQGIGRPAHQQEIF